MKHLASLYTLITVSAMLLLPQVVFADSSTSVSISNNGANSQNDVNVQSNTGGNTICQNGNCTTTSGGNGQSTVCINGQCQSSNGNIDMQSDNGNDQVHISNNTSGTPVTVSPSPTEAIITVSPEPSVSSDPSISPGSSITPDPTITQLRRHIRKQIKEQIYQLKEHMKVQNAA